MKKLSMRTNLPAGRRGFNQSFNRIAMHLFRGVQHANVLCINNCGSVNEGCCLGTDTHICKNAIKYLCSVCIGVLHTRCTNPNFWDNSFSCIGGGVCKSGIVYPLRDKPLHAQSRGMVSVVYLRRYGCWVIMPQSRHTARQSHILLLQKQGSYSLHADWFIMLYTHRNGVFLLY